MELFLIRHAQSSNNALADERLRVADPLLTELGQRQAERLGKHLATGLTDDPAWPGNDGARDRRNGHGFNITRLYTSAMRRALQTARPVGATLALQPHVWVDIHESGGIWLDHGEPLGVIGGSGVTRSELAAQFPEFVLSDQVTERGWWHGGFESDEAVVQRAARVANQLRAWAATDERIAIITHGGFSDLLLRNLLCQTPACPIFYHLNNTSISSLRFRADGTISIRYLNRVEHLPSKLIS